MVWVPSIGCRAVEIAHGRTHLERADVGPGVAKGPSEVERRNGRDVRPAPTSLEFFFSEKSPPWALTKVGLTERSSPALIAPGA